MTSRIASFFDVIRKKVKATSASATRGPRRRLREDAAGVRALDRGGEAFMAPTWPRGDFTAVRRIAS